ncbi:hypothetical protein [Blautia sp.]|uniref:hypothetical protein n=1 Tax=Blautia sp. TaxID=1955243 RepID=UPI002A75FAB0|nr:hypothetical protein [Blautia sp.]MDY3018339.1 hypothetical protein [Blautia sp.]
MKVVPAQQNRIEKVRLCIPYIQKTFFPVTSLLEKVEITNPRYTMTRNIFEKHGKGDASARKKNRNTKNRIAPSNL